MRLINITTVTKHRIKEMIIQLMPMVGYVRITRHGLVVMKRSCWSFKREILNITDVCMCLLPNKIAELTSEHSMRTEFAKEFNSYISNLVYMKYYINTFDIVDYIWQKYTGLFIIPIDIPDSSVMLTQRTDHRSTVARDTLSV